MKKIKLFLCVALFGAMSFGAFSAYEHYTMSDEERFLLANIEALTQLEDGNTRINYTPYNSDCSCGEVVSCCFHDVEGNGRTCTLGNCNNCGEQGYFIH